MSRRSSAQYPLLSSVDTYPLAQPVEVLRSSALCLRHLDTVGDGSGAKDATGDYSSAAEQFLLAPAADELLSVQSLTILVVDSAFAAADYGAIATGLTNGIHVRKYTDLTGTPTVTDELTDEVPVKTAADWALRGDAELRAWGGGDEFLIVRWSLSAQTGGHLLLDGSQGDGLVVDLNDNFTGLSEHRFMAQGVYL